MKQYSEIPEVIGALQRMGVEGYCQFYSVHGADFTEKLSEGIAIIKSNTEQGEIRKYTVSSYPIWNGPHNDHVHFHGSFTMQNNKIKIEQISLTFKMPAGNIPYHKIELIEPSARELPTAQELRSKLKSREIKPKKRHSIKR